MPYMPVTLDYSQRSQTPQAPRLRFPVLLGARVMFIAGAPSLRRHRQGLGYRV